MSTGTGGRGRRRVAETRAVPDRVARTHLVAVGGRGAGVRVGEGRAGPRRRREQCPVTKDLVAGHADVVRGGGPAKVDTSGIIAVAIRLEGVVGGCPSPLPVTVSKSGPQGRVGVFTRADVHAVSRGLREPEAVGPVAGDEGGDVGLDQALADVPLVVGCRAGRRRLGVPVDRGLGPAGRRRIDGGPVDRAGVGVDAELCGLDLLRTPLTVNLR